MYPLSDTLQPSVSSVGMITPISSPELQDLLPSDSDVLLALIDSLPLSSTDTMDQKIDVVPIAPAPPSVSSPITVPALNPTPSRKRKASLEDKDAKTKQRILRNRAAAQESRDKKRRHVQELEQNNALLKLENEKLSERLVSVENQNATLKSQLDELSTQLHQLASFIITQIPFDGLRESAALTFKTRLRVPSNVRGNEKHEEGLFLSSCSQQRTSSNRRKVPLDSMTPYLNHSHPTLPQKSLFSHLQRTDRINYFPRITRIWTLSLIFLAMISCLSIGTAETAPVTPPSRWRFKGNANLREYNLIEMISSDGHHKVVKWGHGPSNWRDEWVKHPP